MLLLLDLLPSALDFSLCCIQSVISLFINPVLTGNELVNFRPADGVLFTQGQAALCHYHPPYQHQLTRPERHFIHCLFVVMLVGHINIVDLQKRMICICSLLKSMVALMSKNNIEMNWNQM